MNLFQSPTPEPTETERDMHARLVPSDQQIAVAAALIRATFSSATVSGARRPDWSDTFDTCRVVVPIALPGKARGFWQPGQAVEYPPGFWLDSDGDPSDPRFLAERAADHYLGKRAGQVAYAYIWLQNGAPASAVFEGFRTMPTITRPELRGIAESAGIFVEEIRNGGVETGRAAWWEGYGQAVVDLAGWVAGDKDRTSDLIWAVDGPEEVQG